MRLARQWRLERDTATTFVLRMADKDLIDTLVKSRWSPNPKHLKRSQAEQVYEELTRVKERRGPPGGPLDAVAAFGHRWKLNKRDDEMLAKLNHRNLLHVFRKYDESKPLPEVVKEVADEEGSNDEEIAVPDKPGLLVLGRSQSLELIDPFGDALVLGD